jgi:phosphohistidine phosphatase
VREDLRRLLVMRHAKAEPMASTDHERRLTARGQRDAAEAGRWARSVGLLPDHAFVSSAARAVQTWTAFADAAGIDLDVDPDPALFSAGTDAATEVLRTAPADASTVMIVGHNPTMEQLVHLLDDGTADPAVFSEVSAGFPTSAIAVLEVEGDWADLDVAGARITDFHVDRG